MKKVEEDNNSLKEITKKTIEEIDEKDFNKELNEFVRSYYEADVKCACPKFIMWQSEEKRKECVEAKMKMFTSFTKLINSIFENKEMQQTVGILKQRSEYLDKILETNKKFEN